jgi:hypothetical protein
MQEYSHNCIKCSLEYKSNEPDPYYCDSCLEQKKIIAKEVDKKIASIPKKQTVSDLQLYDQAKGGSRFPSIKKLGIKL